VLAALLALLLCVAAGAQSPRAASDRAARPGWTQGGANADCARRPDMDQRNIFRAVIAAGVVARAPRDSGR